MHVDREVKDSVEAFKRDFARFEALQSGGQPDEVEHAQKELLSQLKTLNWCASNPPSHPCVRAIVSYCTAAADHRDMDDLGDAISVVEKNRSKYTLDDAELARRKGFVSDTRAAIGRMKCAVQDATHAAGGNMMSHRRELLRGRGDRGATSAANSSGYGEGVTRDAEAGGGMAQQQLVLKEQDMVLDEVIQATKRLGEMGATIGEELGQQSRLIDEVKSDVDDTNAKLRLAQDKVEALLGSQSESRLMCLVCMLLGVFATLTIFVFYF
jgi:hypothetical protein